MMEPEGPEKDGLPLKAKLVIQVWRPSIRHLLREAEATGKTMEEVVVTLISRDRQRVYRAWKKAQEPEKPKSVKKKKRMPLWLKRRLYG